jgi:cobalamin biosynthesis protein CobW
VSDRIPALIVSGFLGSGKTSLVRHLLAEARERGLRMGIVSNEFGELGIDALLLERPQDDYVELSGGCVCCRLSDALVETLQTWRRRASPCPSKPSSSSGATPCATGSRTTWRWWS